MMRTYLTVIAGLTLLLGAAMVVAQEAPESKAGTVQRAVFKVDNLSCGACLSKINSALEPVEGFSGMGANLLRKMVAVDFSAPLAPEKIGEIITRLGYPAALDSVDALTERQTFAYMRSQRRGGGYGSGSCCGSGEVPASATQCPGKGGTLPQENNTRKDI